MNPLGQSVLPLGGTVQPLLASAPLSPFLQASLLNLSPDPTVGAWGENSEWDGFDVQRSSAPLPTIDSDLESFDAPAKLQSTSPDTTTATSTDESQRSDSSEVTDAIVPELPPAAVPSSQTSRTSPNGISSERIVIQARENSVGTERSQSFQHVLKSPLQDTQDTQSSEIVQPDFQTKSQADVLIPPTEISHSDTPHPTAALESLQRQVESSSQITSSLQFSEDEQPEVRPHQSEVLIPPTEISHSDAPDSLQRQVESFPQTTQPLQLSENEQPEVQLQSQAEVLVPPTEISQDSDSKSVDASAESQSTSSEITTATSTEEPQRSDSSKVTDVVVPEVPPAVVSSLQTSQTLPDKIVSECTVIQAHENSVGTERSQPFQHVLESPLQDVQDAQSLRIEQPDLQAKSQAEVPIPPTEISHADVPHPTAPTESLQRRVESSSPATQPLPPPGNDQTEVQSRADVLIPPTEISQDSDLGSVDAPTKLQSTSPDTTTATSTDKSQRSDFSKVTDAIVPELPPAVVSAPQTSQTLPNEISSERIVIQAHENTAETQRSQSFQHVLESSLQDTQDTQSSEIVQPDFQTKSQADVLIPPTEISHSDALYPAVSAESSSTLSLESPQQLADSSIQAVWQTQTTEGLQTAIHPQQGEILQSTNPSDGVTPSPSDPIAPSSQTDGVTTLPSDPLASSSQTDRADTTSQTAAESAVSSLASPTIDTLQTKSEASAIAPLVTDTIPAVSSTELTTSPVDAIVLKTTSPDIPSLSTTQSLESSLQPLFSSDVKKSETGELSHGFDGTEGTHQPLELESDYPSTFELPASSTHWLHEEPRLQQPLGFRASLGTPALPLLQRQAETGDDGAIAQEDNTSEGRSETLNQQLNSTPDNWSSLVELLNTSTPPTSSIQPSLAKFLDFSEATTAVDPLHLRDNSSDLTDTSSEERSIDNHLHSIDDYSSGQLQNSQSDSHSNDQLQNSQSLEHSSAMISRTADSKAIAPSTPSHSSTDGLSSWSNLSQLLDQSIVTHHWEQSQTTDDSNALTIQRQELPVGSIEPNTNDTSILLSPVSESSEAIDILTQNISTTTSTSIDSQEMSYLATQVYNVIRQQLEQDQERRSGQLVACSNWYSPVVLQPQRSDRSSLKLSARASPAITMNLQFITLTREIYNRLCHRLELERERYGSSLTNRF
jgi:hypothetical protein